MQDLPTPDPRVILLHDLHETTRHAELLPGSTKPSFRRFVRDCAEAVFSMVRERYYQSMLGSGWS